MVDILLILLFLTAFAVVWIEWIPKRRREWPNLFSTPARALRDGGLAVKTAASSAASRRRDRKSSEPTDTPREKKNVVTAARLRNAAGAVCAVVLSPLAAIPSALVLPVLLVAWELLTGNAPHLGDDFQEVAKNALGVSFMAIIATADLFFRHLWISGPLLLAGGYGISAYSIGSGVFWRRYSRGLLLFGTIYPIMFVAADVFDWFDRPFFN